MGWRFRKYINVSPGIRINFGKKRASLSIGGNGLTTNVSKDGIRNTVSLPGTGLSYSSYHKRLEKQDSNKELRPTVLYGVILAIAVFSIAVFFVILTSMLQHGK